MAKKRPGVMFYFEWIEIMEELNMEEKGKLLMGALIYANTGRAPDFTDRAMRVAWRTMKKHVDNDEERYNERVKKGEEAANRRWEGAREKRASSAKDGADRSSVYEDDVDRIFREQDERARRKKERAAY